ncbi:MAG: KpsF/GutQ family sugar-phosphate isomerase [Oligoflexia bacterium]|nr:KpsF/GutQ family sugar-phosphate isomerase [Oligoflexia bacterium]
MNNSSINSIKPINSLNSLNSLDKQGTLQLFHSVLQNEAQAIQMASTRVTVTNIDKMIGIFELLHNTGGNLIFSGVGKSGIVAQKLAATFCSLGLPSFFLHPTEALHGDLGRLSKADAMVIISKSGSTEEIRKLLPFIPIPQQMIIGLLGQIPSPLANASGVLFDCSIEREASINDLAPTTSTIVAMAIGDALAVLYENVMGISKEKFAYNHPGGILGKTLRLMVSDLMITAADVPWVTPSTTLQDVIIKMTEIPLGICVVLQDEDVEGGGARGIGRQLAGIIVDGDIRRFFSNANTNGTLSIHASKCMNPKPITIRDDELAYRGLELMEKRQRQISVLPVMKDGVFLGILRLHDLLREGFVLRNYNC